MRLQCQMHDECTDSVTHIGEKGWIYCTRHAEVRKCGAERCRKMRVWERKLVEAGKPVPSYRPIKKPVPPVHTPDWELIARSQAVALNNVYGTLSEDDAWEGSDTLAELEAAIALVQS